MSDQILEATDAFSVDLPSGAVLMVSRGDLFYADDPIVKGRERLFGEVTVRRSAPPKPERQLPPPAGNAETADASPGSRRTRGVPRPSAPKIEPKGGEPDA